jgi:hypothetical protein
LRDIQLDKHLKSKRCYRSLHRMPSELWIKRLCQNMTSENGGIGKEERITEVEDTIEIDDEVYGLRASPKKVTGKRGPPTGNSDGRRKRTKIGNTNARRRQ